MFAEFIDAIGGRVLHWKSHDGTRELGRIPPAMPGTFNVSLDAWEMAQQHNAYLAKGKRK